MRSQVRILYLFLLVVATSVRATDALSARILDNGLQVVVIGKHGVPLAAIDLVLKSGSFTETEDDNGLANLHAQMLFKATPTFPTQEAYIERARELGIILETHSTEEWVNFRITLPADSLEQGLRFMEESIRYPRLSTDLLEQEQKAILDAMDREATDPTYQLDRAVQTELWGPSFYQKNYQGTRRVISSASLEQVRLTQERYVIPNNAALLVVGDVTPKEALRLVENVFGRWKAGTDPSRAIPVAPSLPLIASSDTVVVQPVSTAEIVIAWQGPSAIADLNGTLAGDLFSFMLNRNSSAFQQNLVASGIALKAEVIQSPRKYVSPIFIKVTCLHENFWVAYQALQDELDKIENPDYFTESMVEEAKRLLAMEASFRRDRTSALTQEIVSRWAIAGLDYYRSYLDNLEAISRKDIINYVDRYISGQPSVTGAMVNRQTQQRLRVLAGTLAR